MGKCPIPSRYARWLICPALMVCLACAGLYAYHEYWYAGVPSLHRAIVAGDRRAFDRHLQASTAQLLSQQVHVPQVHEYEKGPALSLAVRYRRHEMIAALLSAGADPNLRDSDGHTPLYIAIMQSDHGACRMLKRAGAVSTIVEGATWPEPMDEWLANRLDDPDLAALLRSESTQGK